MTLTNIHDGLATTAVLFTAICAIWGIVNYLRNQPVTSGYWGALVLAELLMIAQLILGAVLWIQGGRPDRGTVHLLYGATAVISIPAVYLYTGGRDSRREGLFYGIICLWLFGISLRAIATGGGA